MLFRSGQFLETFQSKILPILTLMVKMQLITLSLCALAEGCPPGHLSVHPKLGLCDPESLTQCAFHLVRMQLTRLSLCVLPEGYTSGHLSVHPKLGLCDPLSLTQYAFHLVRMQLESVCPSRGLPTWAPVCASHTWIVQSLEPDTMYLPSGENPIDSTESVYPCRWLPTWAPVCASQNLDYMIL